ncbi:YgcG family protein [Nitrosomonas sp. Is35]|uniref:TPM domain-containing protein n=1 Tax=Nitrosomonas sp. Is35 TaxID=3080534 RepID=UPI00294B6B9C|nr:YgcG family protein [Nitrosomonas sp. Is35]MDV6347285.1 YgcG family protein [Nitrosomonas sp. Is35]
MILTRMIRPGITVGLLIAMLFSAMLAMADVAIPPLKAHVNDLTATLSASEVVHLEQKLLAFEKTKGSQIAVLMIPTTQPETIEQYSIRVAEAWQLGRKGIDDGILLLIAKNDHALRIEVGYGLEGVIPDAIAKRIIADIMTPHFKLGHFANGIDAGIEAIIHLIQGEPLPPPKNSRNTNSAAGEHFPVENFVSLLIGAMILGRMLQVMLGRLAGAMVTGIGVGIIGWLSFASLTVAILIAITAFFINLFLNSGGGIYRTGRGGWSDRSYRHGGFDRGGFGGGGFGGGGGGFGGGGASGRW